MHTTSKRIELESPGCSGLEAIFQTSFNSLGSCVLMNDNLRLCISGMLFLSPIVGRLHVQLVRTDKRKHVEGNR